MNHLAVHVERRRQVEDVRVGGLLQMRNAHLRHQERAARVDLVHQVVALHVGLQRAGELDGAGIVDADVDAAEGLDGSCDGVGDLRLLADVADDRQRLAAGLLDLLGRRVDRARQLRMRLGGLGRDRHIGAVARRPQRDGQPDAARAAGDEQRLALERHEGLLQLLDCRDPCAPAAALSRPACRERRLTQRRRGAHARRQVGQVGPQRRASMLKDY